MNLPPFWLKITHQHVIDNFEDLLLYLKSYSTEKEFLTTENEDYLQTCQYLRDVALDYASETLAMPMYAVAEFDIPVEMVVRIMAASLFTSYHLEQDTSYIGSALIYLLLLNNKGLSQEMMRDYYRIACDLALQKRPLSIPYKIADLIDFRLGLFEYKMSKMIFKQGVGERGVFEKFGSFIIDSGKLKFADVNFNDYKEGKLKSEFETENGISILTRTARGSIRELDDLLELYPRICRGYKEVARSSGDTKKRYSDFQKFFVRVTRAYGFKIEAETIDPDYEYIKGNVYVDKEGFSKIPNDQFFPLIKEGDYLPVCRNRHNTLLFKIDKDYVVDYIEDLVNDNLREELEAVYLENIKGGSRWVSEEGFMLNVFDNEIAEDNLEAVVKRAVDEDFKVRICVDSYRKEDSFIDNSHNIAVKGRFMSIAEERYVYNQGFFEEAYIKFYRGLVKDFNEQALDEMERCDKGKWIDIPEYGMKLIATLIYHLSLKCFASDSFMRVEHLIAAMLCQHVAGNEKDRDFILSQLHYQKAIISFSKGQSPKSLDMPDVNVGEEVEEIARQHRVVDVLRSYHEHICRTPDSSPAIKALGDDRAQLEVIGKLIEASNNLIDKINLSELDRLKKSICARLGVADEYNPIYGDTTNYGIENEFLEFKPSCAVPPEDHRPGSEVAGIEIQKWTILKGVCAFLNSRHGGELLIGVLDSGNASGISADIQLLYRNKIISEPNSDRLRLYVKNFIDHSFSTCDDRVFGSALTSEHIRYEIETTKENREILRIKVQPYPWDVVKIIAPDRPSRFQQVYLRTSGASTPLNSRGILETKKRKMQAINRNDYKIARLMDAIEQKSVVEINNYWGHNEGTRLRRVEPFKILRAYNGFLAYDLDCKDMRMFKFSRFEKKDLNVTDVKWKNEANHSDRSVDIFGMMETIDFPTQKVVLRLTEYAYRLFKEEYLMKMEVEEINEWVTTEHDYSNALFPRKIELKVNSWSGIGRFVLGLPGKTMIESPQSFIDYIKNISSTDN